MEKILQSIFSAFLLLCIVSSSYSQSDDAKLGTTVFDKPFEFSFKFLEKSKDDKIIVPLDDSIRSGTNEEESKNVDNNLIGVESTERIQHINQEFESLLQSEKLLNQSHQVYVRKCCPLGESFFLSLNSCGASDVDFVVPAYVASQGYYTNLTVEQLMVHEGLLTACTPSILERDEFVLFETGDLFSNLMEEFFRPGHYCLETIVDDTEEVAMSRLTAAYCPYSESMPTFDPNKIPVRKCCHSEEVVSSDFICTDRSQITSEKWSVPIKSGYFINSRSSNFTDIYEIVSGYPECVMDERGESLESSWNFHLIEENGYINIPSLGLSTPNYCLDEYLADNSSAAFAYVCLPTHEHQKFVQISPSCAPESEHCIQKCCPASQMLNEDAECVNDPAFHLAPLSIPIFYENGTVVHLQNISFNFGKPECNGREYFLTTEEERAEIMSNGTLRYISYDPYECDPQVMQMIPIKDYCYDKILFGESSGPGEFAPKIISGAWICFKEEFLNEIDHASQVNFIYSIFLGISDAFILISIIIYLTVPDQTKRGLNKNVKLGHSILGRILLSFLFSMFFAYLFLIISKTLSERINIASSAACVSLGVAMYISFLATFFWLNVLCFELWWKCARQEGTSGRRWFWYRLYAWGNPIFLGSIVLYIEFSPSVGACFVKPNFGVQSCFFSETKTFGNAAKWVYLNGPVAVLLIMDLVFFLLTVKTLLQTVQNSHKGTVKRQSRQRLKLCFKLFLVMGISWLTEIISGVTGTSNWYIPEVFNCLQGFIIFLIFIFKPKIMLAVRAQIALVCCGKQPAINPYKGRLTFTASVLSDFLSSTKQRSRTNHLNLSSASSFSNTSSSNFNNSSSSSNTFHYPKKVGPPTLPQKTSNSDKHHQKKDIPRIKL